MTGLDLISRTLRLLGVLASGETAEANDAQDALSTLNDLVDAWKLERLFIFEVVRTVKTLTSGTQSYTIGTGGDINIERPTWIDHAAVILDAAAATPTEGEIEVFTDERWQELRMKTLSSSLPQGVYFDHAWSAGLARVYPWPVPSTSSAQLVLYTPGTAVARFANLTTNYTFPPGYARMLRFNLAVELAPDYGAGLSPVIVSRAEETMGAIKRGNFRPSELKCDPAVTGRAGRHFDIRTGGYR